MPIPFLIPSIISGGMSLIGSGISSVFNSNSQSRANAANYRIMQEQNAYNERMWHMNNAYNTPLAQRQRLEEAGINPALAMSNISTGSSSGAVSSAPSAQMQATQIENPLGGFVSAFSSVMSTFKQNDLIDAQIEKMRADADNARRLADSEIENKRVNNSYTEAQRKFVEMNTERLKNLTPHEIEQAKATVQAIKTKMELDETNIDLNRIGIRVKNKYEEQFARATLANTLALAEMYGSQAGLNTEQKLYIAEQAFTEQARRRGIQLNNIFNIRTLNSRVGASNLLNTKMQADINLTNRETQHIDIKEAQGWMSLMLQAMNTGNSIGRSY